MTATVIRSAPRTASSRLKLAALAIPLVVLALQREKWRRRKLEGRTREMDDEDLKKALAARQPVYERAAQAESAAAADPAEGLPEPE